MKTLFAVCSALSLVGALTVTAPAMADDHGGDRGGDHGGDHRGGNGNAVAAGVLGVVLGAAIADSADHRAYYQQHANDNDYHNRCAARYHSYDRASGTYLGSDGHRHYCHL
jgi:hypothetical protein